MYRHCQFCKDVLNNIDEKFVMSILVIMDFIVDKFKLLGLNPREIKVFTALATFGRMNMTKIASRSQLPRTTVDAIVRRLVKQGLVTEEKVRGHLEYVMNPEDVANKLDWVEKRLRPKDEIHKGEIHKNDEKNVIMDIECDNIEQELHVYFGDRVKLLFSHEYGDENSLVDRLIRYIDMAIRADLKLEILLSTKTADALRDREHEVPVPKDSNAIRLNIVPSSYGTISTDLFVLRDAVLLSNPSAKRAEKILHKDTVETSKHLLGVACETGWSINLVAWIREN